MLWFYDSGEEWIFWEEFGAGKKGKLMRACVGFSSEHSRFSVGMAGEGRGLNPQEKCPRNTEIHM